MGILGLLSQRWINEEKYDNRKDSAGQSCLEVILIKSIDWMVVLIRIGESCIV